MANGVQLWRREPSSSSLIESGRRYRKMCRWCIFATLAMVTLWRISDPSLLKEEKGKKSRTSSSQKDPSRLADHKASLRYMGNRNTNTGWNVDTLCLHKQSSTEGMAPPLIVYGVGAGEDISWDVGMIEEYGATVVILDPTPKAKKHVDSVLSTKPYGNDPATVQFLAEGLSHEEGQIIFALPANPDHVSMRAVAMAESGMTETVSAPVRTLKAFMTELGHEYLDILKIDIEGAEYDVLEGLIHDNFMPFTQLLVEYHDRFLKGEERKQQRHANLLAGLQKAGFVELWSQNGGQERGYVKVNDMQYCADGVSKRFSTIRPPDTI